MDDSKIVEKPKRIGISNLKTKKKSNKPEFGLYNPNSGVTVYYPADPDDPEEELFRINLQRVFCRRQDYIKAQKESQPQKPKAEEPEIINSETIPQEKLKFATRNEDE
jgi:hypothetical protein